MGLCRDVQPLRRHLGEAFVRATGMPDFASITARCAGLAGIPRTGASSTRRAAFGKFEEQDVIGQRDVTVVEARSLTTTSDAPGRSAKRRAPLSGRCRRRHDGPRRSCLEHLRRPNTID